MYIFTESFLSSKNYICIVFWVMIVILQIINYKNGLMCIDINSLLDEGDMFTKPSCSSDD